MWFSLLSFPRKWESIWPFKVNMDSHFRGNDIIGNGPLLVSFAAHQELDYHLSVISK